MLTIDQANNFLQNGSPDAVALVDVVNMEVIDNVAYEEFRRRAQIADMTLDPGDVFVVCNSAATAAITSVSDLVGSAVCQHNGDDDID